MHTKWLNWYLTSEPGTAFHALYLSILSKLCVFADGEYTIDELLAWIALELKDKSYNRVTKDILLDLQQDLTRLK